MQFAKVMSPEPCGNKPNSRTSYGKVLLGWVFGALCLVGCLGPPPAQDCGGSCGANASCADDVCRCDKGFALEQGQCADIDECAADNGGCGDSTFYTCKNNQGSAPTCGTIDACQQKNGGCGDSTFYACKNNQGSAPTCSDIDECQQNNGGCGSYSACTNNPGAAPTCSDIDECQTNNGGCGDPLFVSCKNNLSAAPSCEKIGCNPGCACKEVKPVDFPIIATLGSNDDDHPAASCGGKGPDLAVTFVAPATGDYIFNTYGSSIDTVLYALQDGCGGAELACKDDYACGTYLDALIKLSLQAGQRVLLVVSGRVAGKGGQVRLNHGVSNSGHECTVGSDCNKVCPTKALMLTDFPLTVDTSGLAHEVVSATCGSGSSPDHTFRFTAKTTGRYTFKTDGSAFDTRLTALTADCKGKEISCNDGGGDTKGTSLALQLKAGEQVLVSVGGYESCDFGQAKVDLVFDPPCKPKDVLFVGDSYTSYWSLPTTVKGLAKGRNCNIHVDYHAPAGASFKDHKSDPLLLAKLSSRTWDVVVLQNQGQAPAMIKNIYKTSFYDALALARLAHDANAPTRIVYMATWGRKKGDQQNCSTYPQVCTFAGQTAALMQGYGIYEYYTGDTIAPVGEAWKAVVDDAAAPFKSDLLWMSDGSHPSRLGSYLAAAVLLPQILGVSPLDNSYKPLNGNGDLAKYGGYLQKIAAAGWKPGCGNTVVDIGEECDESGKLGSGNNCDPKTCTWAAKDAYEPDGSPAQATALVTDGPMVKDHNTMGAWDVDYFSFPATAGKRYVIHTYRDDGGCIGDPGLTLYDTDGTTVLKKLDDGGPMLVCPQILFAPKTSGTFYVAVWSGMTRTGKYELGLKTLVNDSYEDNDTAATATSLSAIPASLANLVDNGDPDWFVFSATAGTTYTARVVDSYCKSGDASSLEVAVYRADGTTLLGQDAEKATEQCPSVSFKAPASEATYVRVTQRNRPLWNKTYGLKVSSP